MRKAMSLAVAFFLVFAQFASFIQPTFALQVNDPIVNPNIGGKTAEYTIPFSVGSGKDIPLGGSIRIDFPQGTTLPSTMDPSKISVGGAAVSLASTSGTSLVIKPSTPVAHSPAIPILIKESAGIKNPLPPQGETGNLKLKITTFDNGNEIIEGPVDSGAYFIAHPLTVTPGSDLNKEKYVPYALQWKTGNQGALSAGDTITLSFQDYEILNYSGTIPAVYVKVNGTHPQSAVTYATIGVYQEITIPVPMDIPNNSDIKVELLEGACLQNPSIANGVPEQDFNIAVFTQREPEWIITPLTIKNAVEILAVRLGDDIASLQTEGFVNETSLHRVRFQVNVKLDEGQSIIVRFPPQMTLPLPGTELPRADFTFHRGSSHALNFDPVVLTNNRIEIKSPVDIDEDDIVRIDFSINLGFQNPIMPGLHPYYVQTTTQPYERRYNVLFVQRPPAISLFVTPGSDLDEEKYVPYALQWKTGNQGALSAGDTITLSFQDYEILNYSGTIPAVYVKVNGTHPQSAVTYATIGGYQEITIPVPMDIPNNSDIKVELLEGACLQNPSIADDDVPEQDFNIAVFTQREPEWIITPLTIKNAVEILAVRLGDDIASLQTEGFVNETVNHRVRFKSNITLPSDVGTITVRFPSDMMLPPPGTELPVESINFRVIKGLTASDHLLTLSPIVRENNKVEIKSPADIDKDDIVRIDFSLALNFKNPTLPGTYYYHIQTLSQPYERSFAVDFLPPPNKVEVTPSSYADAEKFVQYKFKWTLNSFTIPVDSIYIYIPSDYRINGTQTGTILPSYVLINGEYSPQAVQYTLIGDQIRIALNPLPRTLMSGEEVEIVILSGANITNPVVDPDFYQRMQKPEFVIWSGKSDGTNIDEYEIEPFNIYNAISLSRPEAVVVDRPALGETAEYTIYARTDYQIPYMHGSITLKFPEDTILPVSAAVGTSRIQLSLDTGGFPEIPLSHASVNHSSNEITLFLAENGAPPLGPNSNFRIVIPESIGIINPSAQGYYTLQIKSSSQPHYRTLPRYRIDSSSRPAVIATPNIDATTQVAYEIRWRTGANGALTVGQNITLWFDADYPLPVPSSIPAPFITVQAGNGPEMPLASPAIASIAPPMQIVFATPVAISNLEWVTIRIKKDAKVASPVLLDGHLYKDYTLSVNTPSEDPVDSYPYTVHNALDRSNVVDEEEATYPIQSLSTGKQRDIASASNSISSSWIHRLAAFFFPRLNQRNDIVLGSDIQPQAVPINHETDDVHVDSAAPGVPAQYTIRARTNITIPAMIGYLEVTFPAGTGLPPEESFHAGNARLYKDTGAGIPVTIHRFERMGQTIRIYLAESILQPSNIKLVFDASLGITNPSNPGVYSLQISSSTQPEPRTFFYGIGSPTSPVIVRINPRVDEAKGAEYLIAWSISTDQPLNEGQSIHIDFPHEYRAFFRPGAVDLTGSDIPWNAIRINGNTLKSNARWRKFTGADARLRISMSSPVTIPAGGSITVYLGDMVGINHPLSDSPTHITHPPANENPYQLRVWTHIADNVIPAPPPTTNFADYRLDNAVNFNNTWVNPALVFPVLENRAMPVSNEAGIQTDFNLFFHSDFAILGGGTISIAFPYDPGIDSTYPPSMISVKHVGSPTDPVQTVNLSQPIMVSDNALGGKTITITLPQGNSIPQKQDFHVQFRNIRNPHAPGAYQVQVMTSAQPFYQISPYFIIQMGPSSFALTLDTYLDSSRNVGAEFQFKLGNNEQINIGDPIVIRFSSDYTKNLLNENPTPVTTQIPPAYIEINGQVLMQEATYEKTSGTSSLMFTIPSNAKFVSGDVVRVRFLPLLNLTHPDIDSTTQLSRLYEVSLVVSGVNRTARYTIFNAPLFYGKGDTKLPFTGFVAPTLSSQQAGARNVAYTLNPLCLEYGLAVGEYLDIQFPPGTYLPVNIPLTSLTMHGNNPESIELLPGNILRIKPSVAIPPSNTAAIILAILSNAGIRNPEDPGSYMLYARTMRQPFFRSSPAYTITPAPALMKISATDPADQAVNVGYTFEWTLKSTNSNASVNQFQIAFPAAGFSISNPGLKPGNLVYVNGIMAQTITVAGNIITVTIPEEQAIPNHTEIKLVILPDLGIVNPQLVGEIYRDFAVTLQTTDVTTSSTTYNGTTRIWNAVSRTQTAGELDVTLDNPAPGEVSSYAIRARIDGTDFAVPPGGYITIEFPPSIQLPGFIAPDSQFLSYDGGVAIASSYAEIMQGNRIRLWLHSPLLVGNFVVTLPSSLGIRNPMLAGSAVILISTSVQETPRKLIASYLTPSRPVVTPIPNIDATTEVAYVIRWKTGANGALTVGQNITLRFDTDYLLPVPSSIPAPFITVQVGSGPEMPLAAPAIASIAPSMQIVFATPVAISNLEWVTVRIKKEANVASPVLLDGHMYKDYQINVITSAEPATTSFPYRVYNAVDKSERATQTPPTYPTALSDISIENNAVSSSNALKTWWSKVFATILPFFIQSNNVNTSSPLFDLQAIPINQPLDSVYVEPAAPGASASYAIRARTNITIPHLTGYIDVIFPSDTKLPAINEYNSSNLRIVRDGPETEVPWNKVEHSLVTQTFLIDPYIAPYTNTEVFHRVRIWLAGNSLLSPSNIRLEFAESLGIKNPSVPDIYRLGIASSSQPNFRFFYYGIGSSERAGVGINPNTDDPDGSFTRFVEFTIPTKNTYTYALKKNVDQAFIEFPVNLLVTNPTTISANTIQVMTANQTYPVSSGVIFDAGTKVLSFPLPVDIPSGSSYTIKITSQAGFSILQLNNEEVSRDFRLTLWSSTANNVRIETEEFTVNNAVSYSERFPLVDIANPTLGSDSSYRVRFRVDNTLLPGHQIEIKFPDRMTLPDQIRKEDIRVLPDTGATPEDPSNPNLTNTAPVVNKSNNTILITLSEAIAAPSNVLIVFNYAAGLTNPLVSGQYELNVKTTSQPFYRPLSFPIGTSVENLIIRPLSRRAGAEEPSYLVSFDLGYQGALTANDNDLIYVCLRSVIPDLGGGSLNQIILDNIKNVYIGDGHRASVMNVEQNISFPGNPGPYYRLTVRTPINFKARDKVNALIQFTSKVSNDLAAQYEGFAYTSKETLPVMSEYYKLYTDMQDAESITLDPNYIRPSGTTLSKEFAEIKFKIEYSDPILSEDEDFFVEFPLPLAFEFEKVSSISLIQSTLNLAGANPSCAVIDWEKSLTALPIGSIYVNGVPIHDAYYFYLDKETVLELTDSGSTPVNKKHKIQLPRQAWVRFTLPRNINGLTLNTGTQAQANPAYQYNVVITPAARIQNPIRTGKYDFNLARNPGIQNAGYANFASQIVGGTTWAWQDPLVYSNLCLPFNGLVADVRPFTGRIFNRPNPLSGTVKITPTPFNARSKDVHYNVSFTLQKNLQAGYNKLYVTLPIANALPAEISADKILLRINDKPWITSNVQVWKIDNIPSGYLSNEYLESPDFEGFTRFAITPMMPDALYDTSAGTSLEIPANAKISIDFMGSFGIQNPMPGVYFGVARTSEDLSFMESNFYQISDTLLITKVNIDPPGVSQVSEISISAITYNRLRKNQDQISIAFIAPPTTTGTPQTQTANFTIPANIGQGSITVNGKPLSMPPVVDTRTQTISFTLPDDYGTGESDKELNIVISKSAQIKNPAKAGIYTVRIYPRLLVSGTQYKNLSYSDGRIFIGSAVSFKKDIVVTPPNNYSQNAEYKIEFSVNSTLSKEYDKIYVIAKLSGSQELLINGIPPGRVQVNKKPTLEKTIVERVGLFDEPGHSHLEGWYRFIIPLPENITSTTANVEVVIGALAKLQNPESGSYRLYVRTSNDAVLVPSSPYNIYSSVKFGAPIVYPPTPGSKAEYTLPVLISSSLIKDMDTITVDFASTVAGQTTQTQGPTIPTATNINPNMITVDGMPLNAVPTVSSKRLTFRVPKDLIVDPNTGVYVFNIVFKLEMGITNPTARGTYNLKGQTSSQPYDEISPNYYILSAVTDFTVLPSTGKADARNVEYTLNFKTGDIGALVANRDKIEFLLNVQVLSANGIPLNQGFISSQSFSVTTGTTTPSGTQVNPTENVFFQKVQHDDGKWYTHFSILVPTNVAVKTAVTVKINSNARLMNPGQGKHIAYARTSIDPDWMKSQEYFISDAIEFNSIALNPAGTSLEAEYNITIVSGAALMQNQDTISIVFPKEVEFGTGATGTIPQNYITVSLNGNSMRYPVMLPVKMEKKQLDPVIPPARTSDQVWVLTFHIPINVLADGTSDNGEINIVISSLAKIKNPKDAGMYRLRAFTSQQSAMSFSPYYVVGGSLSDVAVRVDPNTENDIAQYAITFKLSSHGELQPNSTDKIYVVLPIQSPNPPSSIPAPSVMVHSGAFSATTPIANLRPTTIPVRARNFSEVPWLKLPAGEIEARYRILEVTPPLLQTGQSYRSSQIFTVIFTENAGLKNPMLTSDSEQFKAYVCTSRDSIPIGSSYYLNKTIQVNGIQVTPNSTDTAAGYRINVTSPSAMKPNQDTFSIAFHKDVQYQMPTGTASFRASDIEVTYNGQTYPVSLTPKVEDIDIDTPGGTITANRVKVLTFVLPHQFGNEIPANANYEILIKDSANIRNPRNPGQYRIRLSSSRYSAWRYSPWYGIGNGVRNVVIDPFYKIARYKNVHYDVSFAVSPNGALQENIDKVYVTLRLNGASLGLNGIIGASTVMIATGTGTAARGTLLKHNVPYTRSNFDPATGDADYTFEITVPIAIPNNSAVKIFFLESARLINPSPGTYQGSVYTSKETIVIHSGFYALLDAITDLIAETPNPNAVNTPADYVITFTNGQLSLRKNLDTITLVFPSDTTVPQLISKSFITINEKTLVLDPSSAARTNKQLDLYVPDDIAPNAQVQIVIKREAGIINPKNPGLYRLSAFTSTYPYLVESNLYDIGTSVSDVKVEPMPNTADEENVEYKITFKNGRHPLKKNHDQIVIDLDLIVLNFANSLPASTISVNGALTTLPSDFMPSSLLPGGKRIKIFVPLDIPANQDITVIFTVACQLKNPSEGVRIAYVSTSIESVEMRSDRYSIVSAVTYPLHAIDPSVAVRPNGVNMFAQYLIRFRTGLVSAPLEANKGKITVHFPADTKIPTGISSGTVFVAIDNPPYKGTSYLSTDCKDLANHARMVALPIQVNNQEITLITPIHIPSGSLVWVLFCEGANIQNPTKSDLYALQVKTSSQPNYGVSRSYLIRSTLVRPTVEIVPATTDVIAAHTIHTKTGDNGHIIKQNDRIYVLYPKYFLNASEMLKFSLSSLGQNRINPASIRINGVNTTTYSEIKTKGTIPNSWVDNLPSWFDYFVIEVLSPVDIDASSDLKIEILESAGIVNPREAGNYFIYVWTNKEPIAIDSNSFPIGEALQNVTVTSSYPKPSTVSSIAEYDLYFKIGSTGALRAGLSTITVEFPVGTVLPAFINPADIKLMKVPAGPNAENIIVTKTLDEFNKNAQSPVQVTGRSVTFVVPVYVFSDMFFASAGDFVRVHFTRNAGITNPEIPGAYRLAVASTSQPIPSYSNYYTIVSSISKPQIIPEFQGINQKNVPYTVEFNTGKNGKLHAYESEITIFFDPLKAGFSRPNPSCYTFDGASFIGSNAITVNGQAVAHSPTVEADASCRFWIKFISPVTVDNESKVVINFSEIANIINPSAHGNYRWAVRTSSEPDPVESFDFTIYSSVSDVSVDLYPKEYHIVNNLTGRSSPNPVGYTPNHQAEYQIEFKLGTAGTLYGGFSWIQFRFPHDTFLPTWISRSNISVNNYILNESPILDPQARTLRLKVPQSLNITSGSNVKVVIQENSGLRNPSLYGDYRLHVSTSSETYESISNIYELKGISTPQVILGNPLIYEHSAYTVLFQISNPLRIGQYIYFEFPKQVVLPSVIHSSHIKVNDRPLQGQITISESIVFFPVPEDMPANKQIKVTIDQAARITNPLHAGQFFLKVRTDNDLIPTNDSHTPDDRWVESRLYSILTTLSIQSLEIKPISATLSKGKSQLFSAIAKDELGNEISSGLKYRWAVQDNSVGNLNAMDMPQVVFTAGQNPGKTKLLLNVDYGTSSMSASADITVSAALNSVVISPSSITVQTGKTQQFSAKAFDEIGNEMELEFEWSIQGPIGSLNPARGKTTTFTASSTENSGQIIVRASFDGVVKEAVANVKVSTVQPTFNIAITPSSLTIQPGRTQVFTAKAVDETGKELDVEFDWSLIGAIGNFAPSRGKSTTFTASTTEGSGQIKVAASFGGISKEASAQITVSSQTKPPDPEDNAFSVVVAPATVQSSQAEVNFSFTVSALVNVDNGSFELMFPDPFAAPVLNSGSAGFVDVRPGTGANVASPPSLNQRTVSINVIKMTAGQTFTVSYSRVNVPDRPGEYVFTSRGKATSEAAMTEVKDQPKITVVSASDGAGRATIQPNEASSGAVGQRFAITFVADAIMDGGAISITIPDGWTRPTLSNTSPGYVTLGDVDGEVGAPEVSGYEVTIAIKSLGINQKVTLLYTNVEVPRNPNTYSFLVKSKGSGGLLKPIVLNPSVKVENTRIADGKVEVSPNMTNTPAEYSITFRSSLTGFLPKDSGRITLVFPAETTLPASISSEHVSVNGKPVTQALAVDAIRSTLTLSVPDDISSNSLIMIKFAPQANIVNPRTPKDDYNIRISTSSDSIPTATANYRIVVSLLRNINVTVSPIVPGASAAYTISFMVGGAGALNVNQDTVTLVFPSDTVLPASIAANSILLNGNPLQVRPQIDIAQRKMTFSMPVRIENDSEIKIEILAAANIKNPTRDGMYRLKVSTSKETNPVDSEAYQIGTSLLGDVKVSLSTSVVETPNVTYTISFRTGAYGELKVGDTVTVNFDRRYRLTSIQAYQISINGVVATVTPEIQESHILVIKTPISVSSQSNVTLAIGGITNPSDGGEYTLSLATQAEPMPVVSTPYRIGMILETKLTVNPSDPNGLAGWYTIAPNILFNNEVSNAQIFYSWNQGNFQMYTGGSINAPEGSNMLTWYSTAENFDDEPKQTRQFKVDTRTPVVRMIRPTEGFVSTTPTLLVEGEVDEDNAFTVTVNERPATVTDKRFSITITLNPGENWLDITATDEAGNRSVTPRIRVTYTVPSEIKFNITSPRSLSFMYPELKTTALAGSYQLSAAIRVTGSIQPANASTLNVMILGKMEKPETLAIAADGSFDGVVTIPVIAGLNGITFSVTDAATGKDYTTSIAVVAKVTLVLQIGNALAFMNDKEYRLDAPPYIKNARTMLPMRFIGESFGAAIGWNAEQRKVSYTLDNIVIELVIGNTKAVVKKGERSEEHTLDVAPEIVAGRTFVPVRFVSEQLGAEIQWDANTKKVTIVK